MSLIQKSEVKQIGMSPPNPNGKKYLSKVGKLILDNLLLLRKCDLKIKDVISNNLFKYPHSMTQS